MSDPHATPVTIKVSRFKRWFTEHPETVNESYFEHQKMALRYSAKLAYAASAALVHALVPCLCQSTAREAICDLHGELTQRASNDKHRVSTD